MSGSTAKRLRVRPSVAVMYVLELQAMTFLVGGFAAMVGFLIIVSVTLLCVVW